jgi:hypothetical protein
MPCEITAPDAARHRFARYLRIGCEIDVANDLVDE